MPRYAVVKKCFCLTILILFFLAGTSLSKIYIDISSPFIQKIPIAVTPLKLNSNIYENRIIAGKLAKCLGSDLLFHGFFSVYTSLQTPQGEKLDYLVKGELDRSGRKVSVILKLIDLSDNSMLVGRKYLGGLGDIRKIAHRFSNEIVKAITGRPGVTLSRIVFISETAKGKEIYTADFDGMNIRQETRLRTIVMSPRFSPDGNFIVFNAFKTGRPCLYIKNLRTNSISRLSCLRGINMSPSWHPSGKILAVTLSKSSNPDLFLIDVTGRILKRLTHGPGINCSPSFSPDGKRLVFVSDRSGTPQLFLLEISTGRIKRLTFSGSYNTDPKWSPVGDRIVYVSRVGGQFQVFTISPEGTDPIQLTFEGTNENPSWSPDGRQILFSSNRINGKKHLFVMLANGQNQRLLLKYGKQDYFPFWGPNTFK